MIEEKIRQHEELEKISSCVNSIRINAARDSKGKIRLIGACLKCGAEEAAADDFHSGGIAYPLDLKTGTVAGPGRNNKEIRDYERHPGSLVYMRIYSACWDAVIACVTQAMEPYAQDRI